MTAVSSTAVPRAGKRRLGAIGDARPLWIALAITALVTALRLTGTVDSDVAWQLWIAGRIHAGANLYRDIIETNPPLWFWMALPVERVAALLHVRIEPVLVAAIGGLVALSLAATDRLIGHIAPGRRTLLLGYAALTLAAMPWTHVGQREQIAMIGTLPYAALIAARRERKPVSPWLAALIGIGAGLDFALKHYFLLVPALLELWLIAGERRRWRATRPETAAIIAVGLAYAAGLFLFERDFIMTMVPLLTQAYGAFSAPSLRNLLGPAAITSLTILAALAAHGRVLKDGEAPFASALLIATIGFAAAYFIQFKGWPYHAIPMLGCGSVGLAALLAESTARMRLLRLAGPALLCLPLSVSFSEALHPRLPSQDLLQAISGLPPGTPVGFISEDTALAWSVTLQRQFDYPSRYNGFWMLNAVVRNEQATNPDSRLAAAGREVVANTVADFRCMPPRRIIIARPQQGTWSEHTIDPLPYFLRNREFAELLSYYRATSRTSLEVYERISPVPVTDKRNCIHRR